MKLLLALCLLLTMASPVWGECYFYDPQSKKTVRNEADQSTECQYVEAVTFLRETAFNNIGNVCQALGLHHAWKELNYCEYKAIVKPTEMCGMFGVLPITHRRCPNCGLIQKLIDPEPRWEDVKDDYVAYKEAKKTGKLDCKTYPHLLECGGGYGASAD